MSKSLAFTLGYLCTVKSYLENILTLSADHTLRSNESIIFKCLFHAFLILLHKQTVTYKIGKFNSGISGHAIISLIYYCIIASMVLIMYIGLKIHGLIFYLGIFVSLYYFK